MGRVGEGRALHDDSAVGYGGAGESDDAIDVGGGCGQRRASEPTHFGIVLAWQTLQTTRTGYG